MVLYEAFKCTRRYPHESTQSHTYCIDYPVHVTHFIEIESAGIKGYYRIEVIPVHEEGRTIPILKVQYLDNDSYADQCNNDLKKPTLTEIPPTLHEFAYKIDDQLRLIVYIQSRHVHTTHEYTHPLAADRLDVIVSLNQNLLI